MVGWVDSSIYYSLFIDGPSINQRFDQVYFAIRWPWIILGQVFFSALPLEIAIYSFSVAITTFVGVGVYVYARCFLMPASSLVAAILACCNLQVVQTVVSAYPSIFSAALVLIGATLATKGYRQDRKAFLVLAGIAYGLALMAHQFSLILGLPLHFVILFTHRNGLSWKDLSFREFWIILGEIIVGVISLFYIWSSGLSIKVFNSVVATARAAALDRQGGNYAKPAEIVLTDGAPYFLLFTCLCRLGIHVVEDGGFQLQNRKDKTATDHTQLSGSVTCLVSVGLGGKRCSYSVWVLPSVFVWSSCTAICVIV